MSTTYRNPLTSAGTPGMGLYDEENIPQAGPGEVDYRGRGLGSSDFIEGMVYNKPAQMLRIGRGEEVELLLSPWTPQHLKERKLVFHNWVGGGHSNDWVTIRTDMDAAVARRDGARLNKKGEARGTTFKPKRVLCTALSGPRICGHCPCPICALLDKYHVVIGGWKQWATDQLYPHGSYNLEVQPLRSREEGGQWKSRSLRSIRFLSVSEKEARMALGRRTAEDFGDFVWKAWRDDKNRVTLKPTGRISDRGYDPIWGAYMPVRIEADEKVQAMAAMIDGSSKIIVEDNPVGVISVTGTAVENNANSGIIPEDLGPNRADAVMEALGQDTTLVPLVWGLKLPAARGWMEKAQYWMEEWEDYSEVLNRSTIAMICGPQSDNLVSLDLDKDAARWAERFCAYNPWMRGIMTVYGNRGRAPIFRLKGQYKDRVFKLKITYDDKSDEYGHNVVDHIGELRCGKCLQTISGLHPKGTIYRIENPGVIPTVTFDSIKFPDELDELKSDEDEFGPRRYRLRDKSACRLDLEKLRFLRDHESGDSFVCQCPSCAAKGKDTDHDNLRIWKASWGFHCAAGCDREEVIEQCGREDFNDDENQNRDTDETESYEGDDE